MKAIVFSEFVANMGHELRTPLNTIIGFSDILGEQVFGPLNENQRQYVMDILQSGQHLLTLLNEILDLARLESGTLQVDWHEIDMAEVVARALQMVRERALRAEIKLGSEISGDCIIARGDGFRLRQMLLSLLSLALKGTPAGGAVMVRLQPSQDGVQLSVAASGAAFAAVEKAATLQGACPTDFQRGHNEAELCLGFSLVGQIVELHAGRAWAEKHAGGGSTFLVWLPERREAEHARVAGCEPADQPTGGQSYLCSRARS